MKQISCLEKSHVIYAGTLRLQEGGHRSLLLLCVPEHGDFLKEKGESRVTSP